MLFAEKRGSFYVIARVFLLVFCAVVAFIIGAFFLKENDMSLIIFSVIVGGIAIAGFWVATNDIK